MPIAYIDSNRGNDTTGTGSINNPYRTLQKVANWNAGAGGGILLARDSFFDFAQTLAASNALLLTSSFNGVEGDRAFIDAYDPPGVGSLSSKPTIRARMLPTSSDWLWDSTVQGNDGLPRGWYLQFSRNASFWDARVKVAGQYAVTMNQDTTNNTGLGYINGGQNGNNPGGFVNDMTLDTLRFNLDFGGLNVGGSTFTRLYLSGAGLRTPGAGNDPSSVVGPNAIEVSFGTAISMFDAGQYTTVKNIRVIEGAGLLVYQGTADTVRRGFELSDCEFYDTNNPIRLNQGTGTAAATRWEIDIARITAQQLTGPCLYAFGAGITGAFRDSVMEDGNLASSMGGGVYMQINPTTEGGVRSPFVVKNNVARRWKNGAGNNEFDGGCYYVDVNDNGTILIANRAYDSYVAFQCGSGKRSEWYSNIAINCEVFAMFNNPNNASWRQSDYHFCNNLFVAAPRNTYTHGDVADVHSYHAPMYHVGPTAELVQIRFRNNVMVNYAGGTSEVPLLLGVSQNWTDAKVSADTNAFIGYGARLVNADYGATNKTSSATSLSLTLEQCGFVNYGGQDYRLSANSALWEAGTDLPFAGTLDAVGRYYYSPPSVGPYEIERMPDWFWRPHT
jgi:hypothetical protein